MPEPWQILSSTTLLTNPWFRIRKDVVRLPNGAILDDYHVLEEVDFVKVCSATEDGDIVFVRDYKHGGGVIVLELPGGLVEDGEDPAAAATRELREETGFDGELEKVLSLAFNPTREPTREHIFCGRVTRVAKQRLDPNEQAEVVLVPSRQVRGMIASGEILPMSSVAALLYCLPLLERG